MPEPTIEIGQVWEHKRNRHRTLRIDWINVDLEIVYPIRSTSRRKQAISFKTLRREYRPRQDEGLLDA